MKYLFGPVSSRRYGRSLGVDLAVPKTCTLSCRFCQLGPTEHPTLTRSDLPPVADVLAELDAWAAAGNKADFVTASGSGEPTLHLHFGDVFRWARAHGCRSLLLSNGSLFTLPEVRRDAALADVVKVSLHAWDQASFEAVNRPHPALRLDAIVEGYRQFRREFKGRLDLEVFIVPGINDQPWQVSRIAGLAETFAPDTVSLNTAIRPAADASVVALPEEKLAALLPVFGPHAHITGKEPGATLIPYTEDALIALVSRHPVSLDVLAFSFGKSQQEMRVLLQGLARRGLVHLFEQPGGRYFAGPAASFLHIEESRP